MKQGLRFFDWDAGLIDQATIDELQHQLKPEIRYLKDVQEKEYDTPYAFLNVPEDSALRMQVLDVVQQKKAFNPSMLIIIGIGGSNLGTKAVHDAINGLFYNETNSLKVYCADTTDPDSIYAIACFMEQQLKQGNNVLLNVVSKSGTTTETIANFSVFFNLLKKYKKNDYADFVVATTDKHSKLWDVAHKEKFTILAIPQHVGGRYSVLSAVGLFPLAMLDIDINQLHEGARDITNVCVQHNDNPASLSASLIFAHYQNNMPIHNSFFFATALESVGKWYRQLVGESLGKQFDTNKNEVFDGITPTVAIGSTDLHSLAQLYLGGPRNTFTTFITINTQETLAIPPHAELQNLVPALKNKSMNQIMDAIVRGTKRAYKKEKRPFVSVAFPACNAYTLGQFLQWKMIETVYCASLMNVNPFDQPNVELYKQETREILSNG